MGNFATIVVNHSAFPQLVRNNHLGRQISEANYIPHQLEEHGWAMLHHELCNRNHVPICFERGTFWAINEGERMPSLRRKSFSFYTLFGVVDDLVEALEQDARVGELLWHAATRPDAFPVNARTHRSSCFYVGPTVSTEESGVIMAESDHFWNFLGHVSSNGLEMPEGSNVRRPDLSASDDELLTKLMTAESPNLCSKKVRRLLRNFRGYYG